LAVLHGWQNFFDTNVCRTENAPAKLFRHGSHDTSSEELQPELCEALFVLDRVALVMKWKSSAGSFGDNMRAVNPIGSQAIAAK
jgi:hypothetical protein